MKKLISLIAVMLVITAAVFGQAPQKMSYQAIIKNNLSILVTNTVVGMKISILQVSPVGASVYVETQTPTTDANGLVSLVIGDGVLVSGSISSINWAAGPYYIKTETDPAGGIAYSVIGISQLLSVPYALFAGNANLSGTLNFIPKWTPNSTSLGNSLLFDNGTLVGLGTTTPTHRFEVNHSGATGIVVRSTASFSVVDIDAASGDAALRFANAGVNQWNMRNRPGDNYLEIFELGGGGSRMAIQDATGNVGIGTTGAGIAYRLDVQHGGATGIRSQSTASFSVVDIDAASGDAALRFANAGVNQWNIRNRPGDNYLEIFELGGGGSRMAIQDATGNVGIGTTGADIAYRLDVQHGGATGIRSQSTASFSVVDIDAASGDAALRFANAGVNQWNMRNDPANNNLQIFELGGGGERVQIEDGTGNVGIGGIAPGYRLDVQHSGATGVHVVSTASFSVVDIDAINGDAALRFQKAGVNQWNTRNNPANNDYQIFELGGGGERLRIEDGTGKVVVSGDFTALGTKLFTIDHPLDPENKILMHAAAESNEVINFYSGNVVTDASGKALVSLPDYFEAINKDFRYQLTVIGTFAQAIISKEVSNNKFEIATSQPNVKVSWEVKGVRNDARMQKNPFVAVQEKPAAQKGKYWDPASHNQPASKGISYDANLANSLNDMKPAENKVAPVITGGSLDQMPVQKITSKPVDNSGSVKQTGGVKATVKPVDDSGSVKDIPPVKKEN